MKLTQNGRIDFRGKVVPKPLKPYIRKECQFMKRQHMLYYEWEITPHHRTTIASDIVETEIMLSEVRYRINSYIKGEI